MRARLKIHFDGTAPGLAEHKLDLSTFGEALAALTAGLRRTASAIVGDAAESRAAGRVAHKAKLHVFLEALTGGSLGMAFSVEAPELISGDNSEIFDDLPLRSTEKFVAALEKESKGVYRDSAARKFLRALPGGLTIQKYQVFSGDAQVLEVSIGAVDLPAEPVDLPSVIRTTARILGVTFEPHAEVRLDAGGSRFSCAASNELVDKAIVLRTEEVEIVAVVTGPSKGRLLWLSRLEECPPAMDREARVAYVLGRWEKTLEILGR
ncbi:MAG TPA: hypothetical protein VFG23_15985 [Polyangia bacterium]|nr:hypothetical protein [Polyangia bacterium]